MLVHCGDGVREELVYLHEIVILLRIVEVEVSCDHRRWVHKMFVLARFAEGLVVAATVRDVLLPMLVAYGLSLHKIVRA